MRQGIHDVSEAFLQDGVGHALLERELKHLQVGSERVLVHGVHRGHLGQNEEQDGPPLGSRTVAVSQLLDVGGCLGAQLELLRHLEEKRVAAG